MRHEAPHIRLRAWNATRKEALVPPRFRGRPTIQSGPYDGGARLTKRRLECDLEHDRPRAAAVRVEIKSTRASKPGHPMVRRAALCTTHVRQLRAMGLEIVRP